MKKISILGSTGSIGRSTLDVIKEMPGSFDVIGLSAGLNIDLLRKQVLAFKPEIVSCQRQKDADILKKESEFKEVVVLSGDSGAEAVARYPGSDTVVSAITGIKGLRPTLGAVEEGKTVALANKESMVVGGSLIRKRLKQTKASLIPVDSEHSGIFQCLAKEDRKNIKKVILTASGGPFLNTSKEQMAGVSVEKALAHPRWNMGKKVTIDSATLMNKGLELIEARWLFDLEPVQLDMIIHPQSIMHCLVEMSDGSMLAQLSPTDMKIPIQYALTYPERGGRLLPPLKLASVRSLEFYEVDWEKFPLAALAVRVLREADSCAVTMNAANEEAVQAFLQGVIPFSGIAATVTAVVEQCNPRPIQEVEDVFAVDRESRESAQKLINKR